MFWKRHGIEKKDLLVPASILIGAILISVSICWSSGKIWSAGNKTDRSQAAQAPTAGKAEIAERKDAPRIGNGKIEIVEFSEFQCPFCQRFFNDAYKEIKSKYIDTGKVKIVFRHYPLPFHANAQKAAEAAECANRQGKFGVYHDILFINTKPDGAGISIPDLKQYAKNLGLDEIKFNQCLDNGETASVVKKDFEDGQKAGVSGTPTFFINGEKIVGAQPFSVFQTAIEKAGE